MIVALIIAAALVLFIAAVYAAFALHGRIAALEENADAVAALREEVAGLLAAVDEREREITQQVDECARLAQSTAEQRLALYKMTKAINRDVARFAHEANAECRAVLEEAGRVRDDARQQQEAVHEIVNDDRVKRYLRTGH